MAKFLDHVGLTHYTEKIKELLAGKQDKLAGTPGSVLSFDAQSSPIYVQHWSNPNLLDNWYFKDPINQQGKTEYLVEWSYGIDRWMSPGSSSMVVHDGYITANGAIDQKFEKLPPGVYTVSVLLLSGELRQGTATLRPDFGSSVEDFVGIPNIGGFMWYGGSAALRIQFADIMDIVAAKLEPGHVQTLAHRDGDVWVLNDQPPNKALELAKCQRYRIRFTNNPILTGMTSLDGNSLFAAIHLPTAMRRVPTILQCTLIYAVAGGSSITSFSSVNIYGGAPNQSMFYLHFAVSGLPPATAAGICLGELDLEAQ